MHKIAGKEAPKRRKRGEYRDATSTCGEHTHAGSAQDAPGPRLLPQASPIVPKPVVPRKHHYRFPKVLMSVSKTPGPWCRCRCRDA